MNTPSEQVNRLLARLLRGCLWASLLLVTAGLMVVMAENPRRIPPLPLLTLAEILSHLRAGQVEAVVNLGLLLMLLTPILRVVTLATYFLTHGERKYGLVSVLTLLFLLFDLFAALR